MRYTGNLCDGCKKPLEENDDIVVCPECATPQHRHCYEENSKCVNAHLHGTDFEWKGEVKKTVGEKISTLIKGDNEEKDDIICPSCQHVNPHGSEKCNNCGMKFTMFGINIVEQAQKQEQKQNETKSGDNMGIPEYKPPFEIGKGEGFEYQDNNEQQPTAEPRPEGTNPWNLNSYEDYEEINTFKGPYPVEDRTIGIRTNTLGSFIRNNAQSYVNKFKWSEVKGKNGFNWAAFFFSPYWFFYRKLYKPGIVMITLQTLMSMLIAPVLTPFMEFYEYLMTLDYETLSEAALNELTEQMTVIMADITVPIMLFGLASFAIHLVSGFIANGMYKKYCIKNITQGLTAKPVQEKIKVFAKYGGTSALLVFVSYFAETLLSYLVNYLMY